jgi:hypothetical protein
MSKKPKLKADGARRQRGCVPPPRSRTRRVCSSRISSAMLVFDSLTSAANGAFGLHKRSTVRITMTTDQQATDAELNWAMKRIGGQNDRSSYNHVAFDF